MWTLTVKGVQLGSKDRGETEELFLEAAVPKLVTPFLIQHHVHPCFFFFFFSFFPSFIFSLFFFLIDTWLTYKAVLLSGIQQS